MFKLTHGSERAARCKDSMEVDRLEFPVFVPYVFFISYVEPIEFSALWRMIQIWN